MTGVARLTADLGMSVVVEGVETRPQLALLMRQSSIEEVQGYLFSRPRPATEIAGLLEAGKVDFEQVA